ncbi:MAG: hypothetical protein AB7K67_05380 [Hyphomicrobiaceae bacterium]
MRRLVIALVTLPAFSLPSLADSYVRGYTRNDGQYVEPYHRTNPDNNRFNNYSTQGNVNPYTGQAGTVNPYAPTYNNNYGTNNLYGSSRSRRGW